MSKRNKSKLSVIVLLIFIASTCMSLISGCSTPSETAKEVDRRHIDIINIQMKQIQDDLDAVFLFGRPSRLSDRYVR